MSGKARLGTRHPKLCPACRNGQHRGCLPSVCGCPHHDPKGNYVVTLAVEVRAAPGRAEGVSNTIERAFENDLGDVGKAVTTVAIRIVDVLERHDPVEGSAGT